MAAATFYRKGEGAVNDLSVAGNMLTPLLGKGASVIFALALLLAGLSSSITAGMAGGTIFSGIFNKPYDISTKETRQGVLITMVPAALLILLVRSPFDGLIYSQMLLGMQLPHHCFYTDISYIVHQSYGKICQQYQIKGNLMDDCGNCNTFKCRIAGYIYIS